MNENLLVHTNDKEYKKFLVELKEKVKNRVQTLHKRHI